MRQAKSPRGSILLVSMVILVIMGAMAVAAISIGGKESNAAIEANRAEETRSCAEAGRAYMLAKFKAVGASPTGITLSTTLPDDEDTARRSKITSGHYDATTAVQTVEIVSAGLAAQSGQLRNLSNLMGGGSLGGNYYRVVVHCESRGRQSEVEFMIRFGL